jgi:ubiquinone/menaquinone biosynthesis C-methylase UbiE
MPVYRKGRKVTAEKVLIRPDFNRKRMSERRWLWAFEQGSLRDMENALRFPIKKHVKQLAKKTNPVVVDWGCGWGNAAAELAAAEPKAKVYGFSRDSYGNWNTIINGNKNEGKEPLQNVKFIHAVANDFFRYFKNNSIDLIYSRLGIKHVLIQGEYIKRMIPKLKIGGIIITDTGSEIASFPVLVKHNPFPVIDKTIPPSQRKYKAKKYHQPTYDITFLKPTLIQIKRTK